MATARKPRIPSTTVDAKENQALSKFEDSLAALIRLHTNTGADASFLAAVKIRRALGTLGYDLNVPGDTDEDTSS